MRLNHLQQKRKACHAVWQDEAHLLLLQRKLVKDQMVKFHQDVSSIKCPTCTTCMEKFSGLNVGTRTTKCQRCSRDKHVPKLYSEANNMHPGAALVAGNYIHNSNTNTLYHIYFQGLSQEEEMLILAIMPFNISGLASKATFSA